MCQLTLFGAPALECDRHSLHIPRRKGWALLAYLAVTGQKHTREALASLLWPDYDERDGRADLSRILSTLRKSLGADFFLVDRESVALKEEADLWVDVAHFRRQVQTCRDAQLSGFEDRCRQNLVAAVDLYRADFLAGFTLPGCAEFDDWQLLQTESLRRELGWALEQLVHLHEATGELNLAIDYAQRWVRVDPLHEPGQRRLMALYARNGQRAAAHRQYLSCERVLAEELGVEPQPETKQLYEQIRTGSVESAPLAVNENLSALDWSGSAPEHPFVRRELELAQLDGYLERALNGDGRVMFVTGGAGRGKTSLLREFARRAQQRHPELVVAGGASGAIGGIGDPYSPFREVVALLTGDFALPHRSRLVNAEQARRLLVLLPLVADAIVTHGPQLLGVFVSAKHLLSRVAAAAPVAAGWMVTLQNEVARRQGSPGEFEQTALFGQFSSVLHFLAQKRPLLITLDDLQWVDAASAGLLFHLGRQLAGSRILIIGAFRPDEVPAGRDGGGHPLLPLLDEFGRRYGELFIDLAQASEHEHRAFVDALVDTEPNRLDSTFRQALFRQTGGHPLFTVELLRDMQGRGDLVQDESGQWVQGRQLDWETLPARVDAVIARRIGRLDDELREILDVASVEGEQFHAEVIAWVTGLEERTILRALSQRLHRQHRLVREQGEVEAGSNHLTMYRFNHALFQQYLYSQHSRAERRHRHGEVGAALEFLYAGSVDQVAGRLAHHYMAASQWERAVPHLVRVADLAYRKASLPDAARHYQTALAHWPETDEVGKALALRKLGECLWLLHRHQEAMEALQTSYELFYRHGRNEDAAIGQQLLGRVYWEAGQLNRAADCYQHALALLDGQAESEALAWALAGMSNYHMHLSNYESSISLGEQALALARRLGADTLIIRCLCDLGSALSGMGDWTGVDLERESLERALALDRPHDAGRAYLYIAEALGYLGRYAEARDLLQEALAYARRMQVGYIAESAARQLVELDWVTGRWSSALTRLEEMEPRPGAGLPVGLVRLYQTITFARVYNDLGQSERAHSRLAEAEIGPIDSLDPRVAYLGELARAEMALSRTATSASLVAEILEWSDQAGHLFPNIGMALLYICRMPVAFEHPAMAGYARSACRQLRRLDKQYRTPVTTVWYLEGQGWLCLMEAQANEAVACFEQAAAEWRKLGQPFDHLRALSGLRQALVAADNLAGVRLATDQAQNLINSLASQLKDPLIKASFLESELVQTFRGPGDEG